VDDLIDTAGTLVKGAEALLKKGAASVSACATHAVLSGPAVSRIEASGLKEVVFTNSIPLSKEAKRSRTGSNRCRSPSCWRKPYGRYTRRPR
jgi:ribose-phosphate pyrophosphokinase